MDGVLIVIVVLAAIVLLMGFLLFLQQKKFRIMVEKLKSTQLQSESASAEPIPHTPGEGETDEEDISLINQQPKEDYQPIYEKYVEGCFSHLLAYAIQGVVTEGAITVGAVEKALGSKNIYRQAAKYIDYMLEAGVISENQYGGRSLAIKPSQARCIICPKLMDYPTDWGVSKVIEQLKLDINIMLTDFWSEVDTMSGSEFEEWCAKMLTALGFEEVEITKGSGDQGVDITAKKDEVPYAFQCKCWASDLGNTPVQEVYAGLRYYHKNVGVVITNRYFTKGAKDLAKATDVLLWDRERLKRMMKKVDKKIK